MYVNRLSEMIPGLSVAALDNIFLSTFYFYLHVCVLFFTVLNSIMANFKDLNPYRWPGWSVTALSITLALVVLFFFTETRSFSCANVSRKTCSCLNGLKLSAQLKSKWKIRFLVSFIHSLLSVWLYYKLRTNAVCCIGVFFLQLLLGVLVKA